MARGSIWVILLAVFSLAVLSISPARDVGAAPQAKDSATPSPVSIIFDTDLGLDCDDAGAVAMLHALADRGEAKILAMAYGSSSEWGAPSLASLNAYFGRPEIPVGTLKDAGKNYDLYYPSVGAGYNRDIATRWPSLLKSGKDAPDAVAVYRKALAGQPDGSVVVVTAGNLRNLMKLLQSAADEISALSGAELVKRKVKLWVGAGGAYPSGDEYSFCTDGKAAQYVTANWPTRALISGYEIGAAIRTGRRLFAETPDSPLCVAYERDAGQGSNGRSWSLTAVLAAVRGSGGYWSQVTGMCQTETNGHNTWQNSGEGRHAYLVRKMPEEGIGKLLDELMIGAHRGKGGRRAAAVRWRQPQSAGRQMEPDGQVFREYSWASEKFHVLALNEEPIAIPADFDLKDAVGAEVTLEISSEHMGFEGLGIRLNGNRWYPFTYPPLSPQKPSPSLWYQHWYPTVPVDLKDLKSGTGNTFELKAGHRSYDGTSIINVGIVVHTPWFPVYGVTVRVFYDPARKPHPTGRVLTPLANSAVGLSAELTAAAESRNGTIRQIDFIGRYEDINYEGDCVYNQWHGHPFHGRITHHLGSTTEPGGKVVWDTSWVPDQPRPMAVAARITDGTGLIYLAKPVRGIRLVRPGISVELCKPYDIPPSFTGVQYGAFVIPGVRTEKFAIKGDLTRAMDARYVIPSWGNQKECPGYTINNLALAEKPSGIDYLYNLAVVPIRPLTVLKPGENIFATVVSKGRMPDIYIPGVQILLKYKAEGK